MILDSSIPCIIYLQRSNDDEQIQILYQTEQEINKNYINQLKINFPLSLNNLLEYIKQFKQNKLELQQKMLDEFYLFLQVYKPYILIPLNIEISNDSPIEHDFFSLLILFSKSKCYNDLKQIFIPFIPSIDQTKNKNYSIRFKILLKIYMIHPEPLQIQTGYYLHLGNDKMILSQGSSLDIKFTENFLTMDFFFEDKYQLLQEMINIQSNDKQIIKSVCQLLLFDYLWNELALNESIKLINNNRQNILGLNQSLLKQFWVYDPVAMNVDASISEELQQIIGNFFNFKDEFDYHAEKSYLANINTKFTDELLIFPVLIFIPNKYFLLMKISIFDNCSLVRIKTNRIDIFQYLDEFFEKWEEKDQ